MCVVCNLFTKFILNEQKNGVFYPHLAIDGATYTNTESGFNANGDITGTFTDGSYADIYVPGNGQTRRYTLKKEYNMPTILRAYI